MKATHTHFRNTANKLQSKSKSKSHGRTLEKIYSPHKDKNNCHANPMTNPKKIKGNSPQHKNQTKHKKQEERYHSTSKSKSRQRDDKEIKSKKIISPYLQKQDSKRKIRSIDKQIVLKNQLQKMKKKMENRLYAQGKQILIKLNRKFSQNFQVLYNLGFICEQENDMQQAKKYYKICLKITKNEDFYSQNGKNKLQKTQKLQKLAKCNYFLNSYQHCIQICNKFLAIQHKPNIYQLRGKAQLATQKFGPAIDSFTNAISLDKDNFSLYQFQGDCYKAIQAFQLALNCYAKYSQSIKSQTLNILEKKAECFKFLGNKKKQTQIIQKIQNLKQLRMCNIIKINMDHTKSIKKFAQTLLPPLLRPHTPSLSEAQLLYEKGNVNLSLQMVNKIIQKSGANIKNLHLSALMNFQLEQYEKCQKRIDQVIKLLSNPILPLITFLLPDPADAIMLQNLTIIRNKLKQLNAHSLTEDQDKLIIQRRKRCLQEALNVFKNHQSPQSQKNSKLLNSKLTMIMEESSMKSSRIFDSEQNNILLLREIRKVLKNWCQNQFSLESLQETTDLAFKLVKIRYKQFSILPMHIIYYTFRKQNINKTFFQINQQLSLVLSRMCKKYPPSDTQVSNSQMKLFQANWQNKPKVNLFTTVFSKSKMKFNSFKDLEKAIEIIASRAAQQFPRMNQLCRQICLNKFNGFGFKIGLKVDKNCEMIQQRVLSRVIEKMLSKQIKQKALNFFNDIPVKQNKKLTQYILDIQKQWQQTINQIIIQKNMNNQQIVCQIYDFMRAKCMFFSVGQIKQVTIQFIKAHANGQIYLLQINDRLTSKTRDVVLKFKVKDIVGQLQLALQFESIQNQFNHGLYELYRSPFGPFFSSVMWFSGFALKKNQIFFKQKIKWALNGLQYLRKFIYEEQLPIIFHNDKQQSSIQLILTDFQVFFDKICCHISSNTNLYLHYNEKYNRIQETIEKPKQKYIIKLVKDNFIIAEDNKYQIRLRIQGTQIFFTLQQNKLTPIFLQNSITQQSILMKINNKLLQANRIKSNNNGSITNMKQENTNKDQYGYKQQIDMCRKWQKKLVSMLNANF